MEFDFIQIDTSIDAVLLQSFKDNKMEFFMKLNDEEIEEIKIKKASIDFFISKAFFENPLASEFTIKVYTSTNNILTLEATGEDIKGLFEYIKSIIL